MKIEITIDEVDALLTVTPNRWDNEGNRVEDMPDEEFSQLVDEVKGKTYFHIHAYCNGKMRAIRSPLSITEKRRETLEQGLVAMSRSISYQILNR